MPVFSFFPYSMVRDSTKDTYHYLHLPHTSSIRSRRLNYPVSSGSSLVKTSLLLAPLPMGAVSPSRGENDLGVSLRMLQMLVNAAAQVISLVSSSWSKIFQTPFTGCRSPSASLSSVNYEALFGQSRVRFHCRLVSTSSRSRLLCQTSL